MGIWTVITRLGELQLLAPALVLGMVLLTRTDRGGFFIALVWLTSLLAASLLTTATKIAFIGWGYGVAAWDFTGISGHAMFAAAIYPILLASLGVLLAGNAGRNIGLGIGSLLALLVGWSRLEVWAHSPSEMALGLLAGGCVSWFTLGNMLRLYGTSYRISVAAPILLIIWLGAGVHWAPPSRTHDWVTQIALSLSGRDLPYTRTELHRNKINPAS